MARGGISQDPDKRERQLAALAKGRKVAAERRAAGLPTKATERAIEQGTGRVRPGRYRDTPASSSSSSPKPKPATTSKKKGARDAGADDDRAKPGRALSFYGRLLGYC